eukprot:CAMPEP_0117647944 /NCGR_PEP_ID=MMETSP0804-20121206/120_1 /TAXON_ID=1074897 /ORGANISM="Tetraselmis astigmatica, Strain CCMP880" /LENGTH=169 /DNA_ID=CAMNT_0005453471 /DNA_START=591 /DNA_END=1096 /DNA_ORIENTATION=-
MVLKVFAAAPVRVPVPLEGRQLRARRLHNVLVIIEPAFGGPKHGSGELQHLLAKEQVADLRAAWPGAAGSCKLLWFCPICLRQPKSLGRIWCQRLEDAAPLPSCPALVCWVSAALLRLDLHHAKALLGEHADLFSGQKLRNHGIAELLEAPGLLYICSGAIATRHPRPA